MTNWAKVIEGKIALAKRNIEQGMKPGKISLDARIPQGQSRVTNFPVLDMGVRPSLDKATWNLKLFGLVANEITLSWPRFLALPQTKVQSDMHCVTRWSQLDMNWQGVSARDLVILAQPLESAQYVTIHGYDDYTTNLPLEALLDDDVLIAHSVFGEPLSIDHGWPARMVVPKRYAWKGAKWISAIEFHAKDRPGFWEVRGYHNEADPWKEERFGFPVEDDSDSP
ncbi:MAG: sulfite oxidase-like oxidoreductase [Betaproteobacteria bacterium]|nr:sulfite oxidase-like oxidoreductase [Betaproteobacteria bacterium]